VTLLSPWTFATALAAIALPLLVLHMLKLRRRPQRVSTTLLWRRTVEDLVANAPFQRLRWSLLLVLQLLAAAALATALGRPASRSAAPLGSRLIVLIDTSASMNARPPTGADDREDEREDDGDDADARSGFDRARELARALLASLDRDRGVEAMLVSFARQPRVLSGFERRSAPLLAALDSLAPTDEEADLDAALELAAAFAGASASETRRGGDDEPLPTIVLLTDGNVRPPRDGQFSVVAGAVDVRLLGPDLPAARPGSAPGAAAIGPLALSGANLGITALSAERRYDDPAAVELFARVTNSGPLPVETTLTLRADDRAVLRRAVVVPAATARGLGEATMLERLEAPERALLLLEQGEPDALPSDDRAAVTLAAPSAIDIVVVAPGGEADPFLREVLEAIAPGRVRTVASVSSSSTAADAAPDLWIFDRSTPATTPDVPSLTIGATPPWLSARPPRGEGGRRVLSWDRQHPLLRHVDLDELVYRDFGAFVLEPGVDGSVSDSGSPTAIATPFALVQGADGPILALGSQHGVRHAALGFELRASNLPALPAFPLLLQNAVDWLVAAGAGQAARTHRPGGTGDGDGRAGRRRDCDPRSRRRTDDHCGA
jgi:Ca-activated chloride channel family protein